MKTFFLPILFLFISRIAVAQPAADSLPKADTILLQGNVQAPQPFPVSVMPKDSSASNLSKELMTAPPGQLVWELMKRNTYFNFSFPKVEPKGSERLHRAKGKELLFYVLIILLLLFAFLRQAFPKYFNDLFRLFFRTTIKQRQTKEQLVQTPLPSLLLNGFFILSAGLYTSFLVQHYQLAPDMNFWLLFLYACLGLACVYAVKFAGLKMAGWIFNMEETADAYIFIVFIINKMLGILLLPFLLVLAFSANNVYDMGLLLSLIVTGGLLLYRIMLSFGVVRGQVRVNPFHFFMYLCAFELSPLLLLYKGLLLFFGITA